MYGYIDYTVERLISNNIDTLARSWLMALDSVWNGYQRSMSIRHESMKHGEAKLELVIRFVPVSSFLVSTPFARELKPGWKGQPAQYWGANAALFGDISSIVN